MSEPTAPPRRNRTFRLTIAAMLLLVALCATSLEAVRFALDVCPASHSNEVVATAIRHVSHCSRCHASPTWVIAVAPRPIATPLPPEHPAVMPSAIQAGRVDCASCHGMP